MKLSHLFFCLALTCLSTKLAAQCNPLPTATISGGGLRCVGTATPLPVTITLTGTGPWTFAYNIDGIHQAPITTSTSPYTIQALATGTYTLHFVQTGPPPCTGTVSGSAVVANAPPIIIQHLKINDFCNLHVAVLKPNITGGLPPLTYLWSNGEKTPFIDSVGAGLYHITVTDSLGCQASKSQSVTNVNIPLPIYATLSDSFGCDPNLALGSIDLQPPYSPPQWWVPNGMFNYQWSNGATTEDLIHVPSGAYTVTVSVGTCTNSATFLLEDQKPPSATTATINSTCGFPTGGVDLSPNGSWQPFAFKWSNGAVTEDLEDLPPGIYQVTVTDAKGCTLTKLAKIDTTPVDIEPGAAIDDFSNCPPGPVTGAIVIYDVEPGGLPAPFKYKWSNGSTQPFLTGLQPGSYTLTVSVGTCVQNFTYDVADATAQPVVTATAAGASCGLNNGTITAAAEGGHPPYSYIWSNGATAKNLANLAAGTYEVTVTGANHCKTTASYTVPSLSSGFEVGFGTVPTICGLTANSLINLNISGGNAPFSANWSNGATTLNLANIPAGSYAVTVTSAAGCSKMGSISLADNQVNFTVNTAAQPNSNCAAPFNGTATVAAFPAGNYTYFWGNGQSAPTLANLPSGNYSLTVSAGGNCTQTASVTVGSQASSPVLSANIAPSVCSSAIGSIDLNAQNAPSPVQFFWSNNATTEDISGLAPGNFTVTATAANGCSSIETFNVQNNSVTYSLGGTAQPTTACAVLNGAIDLQVSPAGAYSILWSNGQTAEDLTNLSPGNYTVSVSQSGGCTATATFFIENKPTTPALSLLVKNAFCGGANGAIDLSVAGNAAPFTFKWTLPDGSNGPATEDLAGILPGNYSVVVTNADGCTATALANLPQNPDLIASAISTAQSVAGANDGTASATASGGTFGYLFLWSNGQTTATISGLAPGSYSVTATDANGCTATATVTVAAGPPPCPVSLAATIQNALCNGSADGSVSAQLLNETGPTSFVWSNGANVPQITGLPAGAYSVTATDAKGCTAVQTFTVGQPAPLALSETHQNVSCPADKTGSATVAAAGGTPNYSYEWEDGTTGATLSGIPAGIYTAVATDAHGCSKSISLEIKSADLIAPVVKLKPKIWSIDVNGKATLVAQTFDNGSTDNCAIVKWAAQPPFFDCEQIGLHDVTITATDGAGNSASEVTQVEVVDDMAPVLLCPPNKTAYWCSPVVAYAYPVAYDNCLLLGGQFALLSGIASGSEFPIGKTTNLWQYTDHSGNVGTCSFEVTVFEKPELTGTAKMPTCHGDCDGKLTAVPTGGGGPFSYLWDNGQTTVQATNLCAGNHALTITDGGGCTVQAPLVLGEPVLIAITGPVVVNDIGNAGTGSVSVYVSGGVPGYSFEWKKNGQFFSSQQNLTGLHTGSYVLQVTDANGCVFSSQAFFVDNLVSANEPDWAGGMLLLPNPTSGLAELVLPKPLAENLRIEIFDATGKSVRSLLFDRHELRCGIDLSGEAAGVYQLRITVGGAAVVRQLVKR